MIRFSAIALLSFAIATPALAQPAQRAPNIAGEWVFESPLEPDDGCVISGRAVLTPTRERGVYTLTTRGQEQCPDGNWTSEQNCTARQTGNRVDITCEVVRANPGNYAPDDFQLDVQSRELMTGMLLSTRNGRATWRRARAYVS